jgi:hypothetical protein
MEQKTEYVTAGRKYEFTDHVKPFWMVWSPGHGEPSACRNTCQEARDEAYRLAQEHPGRYFLVLKADSRFCFNNIQAICYG